ncbi:hypothetical protein ACOZ35_06795 [Halorubrum xinjiangense]|uniref:hypothetical protein n=1 Tax=Halorubrum xinjiangense TaxID=261291 RepID=UPI003C6FB820
MYSDLIGEKISTEEKSTKGWVASIGAALQILTASSKAKSLEEETNEIHDKNIDALKKLVEDSRQDIDIPTLSEYPHSDSVYYQIPGRFGFYRHPDDSDLTEVKGITKNGEKFIATCSKSNFSSNSWYARAESFDGIYLDGYGLATVHSGPQNGSGRWKVDFGFIAQVGTSHSTEDDRLE